MASIITFDTIERAAREAFGGVRLQRLAPGGAWSSLFKIGPEDFFGVSEPYAAVALIRQQIEKVPDAVLRDGNWLLSIPPVGPNGFAIDVSKSDTIRCCFGDMEVEFDSLPMALVWVERALSSEFQLRKTFVGKRIREWRLEMADGSNVDTSLAVGSPSLFKWLLGSATVIRQNDLTKAATRAASAKRCSVPQVRQALESRLAEVRGLVAVEEALATKSPALREQHL